MGFSRFLSGVGSTIDLFPGTAKLTFLPFPRSSDAEAIQHDFKMVGQDLYAALTKSLSALAGIPEELREIKKQKEDFNKKLDEILGDLSEIYPPEHIAHIKKQLTSFYTTNYIDLGDKADPTLEDDIRESQAKLQKERSERLCK